MKSKKVGNRHFVLFRRNVEPSIFNWLQTVWTPMFMGVTTLYETITNRFLHKIMSKKARMKKNAMIKGSLMPLSRKILHASLNVINLRMPSIKSPFRKGGFRGILKQLQ